MGTRRCRGQGAGPTRRCPLSGGHFLVGVCVAGIGNQAINRIRSNRPSALLCSNAWALEYNEVPLESAHFREPGG
jgi:hypothetical protein